MADLKILEKLSADELRHELRARAAEIQVIPGRIPAENVTLRRNESLREFDSSTLVQALRSKQKAIYGTDDRQELFQVTDQAILKDAESVVALFEAIDIVDNGNGTSTLRTVNFGRDRNLCPGEPFADQPAGNATTGCFCSGFLVAPDIIATAGHCVNASNVTRVRFVFGFRMVNATTPQTTINNAEIYRGAALLGRQEVGDGPDWALVRIDRPVNNHRVPRIRRFRRIGDNQAVHVIGHPCGLPTKFAGNAVVRNNSPAAFFVANLDTFVGNSGSPVFHSNSHYVEGILVRGEHDFEFSGSCRVSLICPTTGCDGEECTRTPLFQRLIPWSFSEIITFIPDFVRSFFRFP